jgi:hypothetical protein
MKIHFVSPLLLLLNDDGVNAFSPSARQPALATRLFSQNKKQTNNDSILGKNTNFATSFKKAGASFVAAATIFTSSLVSDMAIAPPPAHAAPVVELSRGAFVIETTTTSADQSLLKAKIDSKSLIKTLFVNRKELSSSLGRMQSALQTELDEPVWLEIQKEILSIEGNVVPSIKITPPSDLKQTIEDITQGKVNFLVNGEIFNVAIEPSFSETEDDLVIRVKGFKGERLPPIIREERTQPSQFDEFWVFWDEPYPSQVTTKQWYLAQISSTHIYMHENSSLYFVCIFVVFAQRNARHERRHSHNGNRIDHLAHVHFFVHVLHWSNRGDGKRVRSQAREKCQKDGHETRKGTNDDQRTGRETANRSVCRLQKESERRGGGSSSSSSSSSSIRARDRGSRRKGKT